MKLKIFLFVILITAILCPLTNVCADSISYTVKLKDTKIPVELYSILTEVNKTHRIYTVSDDDLLKDYSKYIEYCETNEELMLIDSVPSTSLASVPYDELYTNQWQSQLVNADFAWEIETYGNEINVAVIDTGCNPHEDINLAGGYNFILNNHNYSDNHGHGTHVSGIIAAQHNDVGIAGIAPKVNIYALKCVDPSYSSGSAELAAAIYAAVDNYGCKVINLSLGIKSDKDVLRDAVTYANQKGAIIISAVGNEGSGFYKSRKWYPAGYDEVIGVGSVGIDKKRSSFSQQNDTVFVVAPGERYTSTTGLVSYSIKEGTSQASPVVSGAAALLLSADNTITPDDFKNYIISCSEVLNETYCGYGLLNIEAMIKKCIQKNECYLSPVNDDSILIYNPSENAVYAATMFANYHNNQFTGANIENLVLLPGKKAKIKIAQNAYKTKIFLWDSSNHIKPLCHTRTN